MNTVIGSIGLTLLLTAFVLNQMNKIGPDSKWYNILNIAGGFLLALYAVALGSIPFIVLECIWTLFASYKLFRIARHRQQ